MWFVNYGYLGNTQTHKFIFQKLSYPNLFNSQKVIKQTAYLGAGDDNTLSKLRQVPKKFKHGLLVIF
jgi:hypothetical protein